VSISVNQWPTSRLGGEARYTYSPDYIDAVAVQERDLNADDDFADGDEVVYYLSNTLYSVYALVDADENVIERYRYDAYGACTVLDADGSADSDGISDVSNAYAFTGRRLDTETGLMQYRNRYYSPGFGRFVSRDPVLYQDGPNLYIYVRGNPTSWLDPLGLQLWEWWIQWPFHRAYIQNVPPVDGVQCSWDAWLTDAGLIGLTSVVIANSKRERLQDTRTISPCACECNGTDEKGDVWTLTVNAKVMEQLVYGAAGTWRIRYFQGPTSKCCCDGVFE